MVGLTLVLALMFSNAFAESSLIDDTFESRIVGGSYAKEGEYPYHAALKRSSNNEFLCGASIIGSIWILTAAHCVYMLNPKDVVVVVGTNNVNHGGVVHEVEHITEHWHFKNDTLRSDIAVLELFKGWGLISQTTQTYPDRLKYTTVRSISRKQCREAFPLISIDDERVCAFAPSGEGMCRGDAGGALNCGNVQYGIASWCGRECYIDKPNVFTNVREFGFFIHSITGI